MTWQKSLARLLANWRLVHLWDRRRMIRVNSFREPSFPLLLWGSKYKTELALLVNMIRQLTFTN